MNPTMTQAQEEVLAAAHRVMSGRIDDRPQGPNDDAEAEYAEDGLAEAAARLARARLVGRLEKSYEHGGPRSALEQRIKDRMAQIADDADAVVGGDYLLRRAAEEAAAMELALVEIADVVGPNGEARDPEELREIAAAALPEGAGKGKP